MWTEISVIATIFTAIIAFLGFYYKHFRGPKFSTEFINCNKTRDKPDIKYCVFFDITNKGNQMELLTKYQPYVI